MGAPLSPAQRATTEVLEGMIMQWCPSGFFGAELECGRKGTVLSDIVTRLEGLCEGLLPRGSGDAELAAPGLEGPRGFSPLKADRIKLPEEPPSVDISKWLGPDLWMAFVEPRSLRSLPARPVTWARPRPRRLGREEKAVLQKWDRTGRLLLAGAAQDPLHRLSTLEALRKDAHADRQIVDRRGPNGEEDRVAGPSRTIPSAADLVDLECSPAQRRSSLSLAPI